MKDWVPVTRTLEDELTPWPVGAMRGLLDRDPVAEAGEHLPLGWHWLYFRQALRASRMGRDGHEARGDFLPPVDAPRRMWAGGWLRSHRPVILGRGATLTSRVRSVKEKAGRSGPLVFVTVHHEIHQGGLSLEEEQTLVYRQKEAVGRAPRQNRPDSGPVDGGGAWVEQFTPTPLTLFQFSALTYNAHRIHYDQPYVTQEEGYPALLVHAPLTALLLLDAAVRHGQTPVRYEYRALSPLFVSDPITLVGLGDGGVEARSPSGLTALSGRVFSQASIDGSAGGPRP